MKSIKINPKKDLVFDLKAKESCKSCKRYAQKATCPPYVDSIEYYEKLLKSYKYGTLYYEQFKSTKEQWEEMGKKSSLVMHTHLLKVRDDLFLKGHYFSVAFGAGSCKLCKECTFPCRNPSKSLIPMEGAGLDVVELMRRKKIKINFPVTESIYRIGLVLYD